MNEFFRLTAPYTHYFNTQIYFRFVDLFKSYFAIQTSRNQFLFLGIARATVYQFLCVTLWHMSIGTWVVRSITLQQINNAPHAETGAQGHNKGLQGGDCRGEKLHRTSISPGVARP